MSVHLRKSTFLWVACWQLLLVLATGDFPARAMGLGFGGETSVPDLVLTQGPLSSPVRLDLRLDSGKELLVTDYDRRAIYQVNVADLSAVKLVFALAGSPLAIGRIGSNILVGNESSGAVELYNRKGRLLRSYQAGMPMVPSDLAVDPTAERVFVADSAGRNIKIFGFDGQLQQVVDGFGELINPMGVAVDPLAMRLAVSDFGDPNTGVKPSLQLFDYSGARLLKITGAFSSPRGVAFAGQYLLMVDTLLGQVLVFDSATGVAVGAVGSFGTSPGQLLLPLDVAWDSSSQTLYVTNNRLGRVTSLPGLP